MLQGVNDESRICFYERHAFRENDRDLSIKKKTFLTIHGGDLFFQTGFAHAHGVTHKIVSTDGTPLQRVYQIAYMYYQ